jgi:hypothetical protein
MAIISISGKINSGKDEVGKITQYLTYKGMYSKDRGMTYQGFIENYNSFKPNFQIKKWADKLKDIVCLLIGCTREQLEDREFKDRELGEEWWYWKYNNELYSFNNEILLLNTINNDTNEFEINLDKFLVKPTPRLLLQLLGTECGRQIIHPNVWCISLFSNYTAEINENFLNMSVNEAKEKGFLIVLDE